MRKITLLLALTAAGYCAYQLGLFGGLTDAQCDANNAGWREVWREMDRKENAGQAVDIAVKIFT